MGFSATHASHTPSLRVSDAVTERIRQRLVHVKRYRPRSILQLLLLGFGLATLPLIVALVTAALYVDRVTEQGQRTIYDATRAVRASQTLGEALTAMERSARQYRVLGDVTLLEVYDDRRHELLGAIAELRRLDLSPQQQQQLDQITMKENEIYQLLRSDAPEDPKLDTALATFGTLARQARTLADEGNQMIARSVAALQSAAGRAHRLLSWQAAALVPAVIALTALFIYIIARPLRQLDQSIRQLGSGEFSTAIHVRGPHDLRELGARLDWMRQRLLELENQKVMFLRHMSHELKTPLTSIREGSELLNEQVVGPLNEAQLEVAALLHSNALRLQRLIEDLLNFSITQSTQPLTSLSPVRLDRVVTAVLAEHTLAMRAKSLQVLKELQEVEVPGDPDKLRTIVDNLISNAVKYSPAHGRMWVRVTRNDGHALIEVQDEGPGIPTQERERVFDPFFQGEATYEGHVKGTGLGLSIAREYVRSHHGEIHVIDQERGALLRIRLPVSEVVPERTQALE